MCTSENRNGIEVTIACGGTDPNCSQSAASTSEVLGTPTYDQNLNPDNPLTNLDR